MKAFEEWYSVYGERTEGYCDKIDFKNIWKDALEWVYGEIKDADTSNIIRIRIREELRG